MLKGTALDGGARELLVSPHVVTRNKQIIS
jgi:hypothetical protein